MNALKTTMLLAALTALLLVIGNVLGGRGGMMLAFILAAGMNIGAYWYSDKLVLRWYRAQEVGPNAGILYDITAQLAQRANLPMPKVYLIEDDAPNAFATGRDPQHASVAATTGILRLLTAEELAGVMAHELSHVAHRDTLIGAVSATIAGAVSMIANMFMWTSMFTGGRHNDGEHSNGLVALLMMLLAPLAASLIQMAISRSREYAADEAGARLCGHPDWLANALEKLGAGSARRIFRAAQENPATAHLFIVNPLHGNGFAQLFSTHPPLDERIERLRRMRI
ncbi:MAG: zinc metalloprotease HtpX [Gammaproteobacteria bacterium]